MRRTLKTGVYYRLFLPRRPKSPFDRSVGKRLSKPFLERINTHIPVDPLKADMFRATVIFNIIENYLENNNPRWISLLKFFLVSKTQKQKGDEN